MTELTNQMIIERYGEASIGSPCDTDSCSYLSLVVMGEEIPFDSRDCCMGRESCIYEGGIL